MASFQAIAGRQGGLHACQRLLLNPTDTPRWGAKWVPSKLRPDGGVVFTPFNASSILLFNPADETYQEAWGGERRLLGLAGGGEVSCVTVSPGILARGGEVSHVRVSAGTGVGEGRCPM